MVTIGGTIMDSGGGFSIIASVNGSGMFMIACTIRDITL
jgi:hypothetical protein